MKSIGRIALLTALACGAAVLFGLDAEAAKINLKKLQTRTVQVTIADGALDSDCGSTVGTAIPGDRVFAARDVQCQAITTAARPLANAENYYWHIEKEAGCTGGTVYNASFGSVDGLSLSPTIPIPMTADYSVGVSRAASNNVGDIYVRCIFKGTFEKAP